MQPILPAVQVCFAPQATQIVARGGYRLCNLFTVEPDRARVPSGWPVRVETGMDLRRISGRSLWRSALILARVNPSIYRARSRFQPGTKSWDLFLVALILPAMVIEVPLATFDAGRMAWSSMPMAFVILGYALLGAGIALSTWAQAVNPFFEPGVRIQRERGQQVISKAPYAAVRHPGYAGALMIFAGLALSLASWWALIPAAWASLILLVRTNWEDDLLRNELEGCSEYAKRTRCRLFPHLW